jgi:hypothetical protein
LGLRVKLSLLDVASLALAPLLLVPRLWSDEVALSQQVVSLERLLCAQVLLLLLAHVLLTLWPPVL